MLYYSFLYCTTILLSCNIQGCFYDVDKIYTYIFSNFKILAYSNIRICTFSGRPLELPIKNMLSFGWIRISLSFYAETLKEMKGENVLHRKPYLDITFISVFFFSRNNLTLTFRSAVNVILQQGCRSTVPQFSEYY